MTRIFLVRIVAVALFVNAIGSPALFAADISAKEQQIADYVDAHMEEAEALLAKVVNIESPTEDLSGVNQVGMLLKKEFDSLQFTSRWINMPPEMKRAGHLIAEKAGTKGQRVLLLGHLDTVLSGERFRRERRRAYGNGVSDMKAGNLVALFALKALHASGALADARVIVLLTGDEEDAGSPVEISRGDMLDAARRSDLALSFENGGSHVATVARRGSSDWTLEVTAKTGHSSQIFKPSMGDGAIFEAARILHEFHEGLRGDKYKYLTFNPSLISGGTEIDASDAQVAARGKTNVVPAKVVVRGDLRFISEKQKETARNEMRQIVAKSLPGSKAKISFADGIPSMTPNDGNYALLKQLDAVSRDLGFGNVEALDPGERGAGDISYVTHLIPGLDGLGAIGGNAHSRGEYVDLDSLPQQIKRAAVLIYRLTR